jgi:hypothetical protein
MGIWAAALGVSISPVFIVTETLMQQPAAAPVHRARVRRAQAMIKAALCRAALATLVNAVRFQAPSWSGWACFLHCWASSSSEPGG